MSTKREEHSERFPTLAGCIQRGTAGHRGPEGPASRSLEAGRRGARASRGRQPRDPTSVLPDVWMKMPSCSGSWLSRCFITLVFLQLPLHMSAESPGSFSPSAVALTVILPVLGIFIMVGIYIIWKQRRSKERLLYEHAMEVENLLSDHAKEKGRLHKALKKLRRELKLKRAAANSGWRRARLHFVTVTLDPDTAHPKLILSEDRKCVKLGDTRQPVPDNPERFDFVVSVLGSEYFIAGCHYWEVSVADKTKWALGVCSESVSRKGKVTASPANGHWLLRQNHGNEYEALTSPQTSFRLKEPMRCVGIFLDYEAGVISFYNVTNQSHIFTFTHSFSGPLRPFFEPCLHDGGKNTAPLIICSELQKPEESTVPNTEEKGQANGDVALQVDPFLLPAQASELIPLRDMILSWSSDLGPALQGLKVPSF
ncbi:erythroid membrane-associated protein [Bos indicus]|uniref:Erythroid membrane-associated protein n=1 Tax=Bos indicus TaxID=9915 RepID=A0ABM4S4U4_BOSIN